ncbi:MAG: hypothetical protein KKH60_09725, partial [Proteobacteria bacterium]|nr:hypothetical protein [Pseudomonadota bacterium]
WWHIGLTFLAIPPQEITWTLRTLQMTGMEIFTMGGEERFVKAVNLTPSLNRSSQQTVQAKQENVKKKDSFLKRVK